MLIFESYDFGVVEVDDSAYSGDNNDGSGYQR